MATQAMGMQTAMYGRYDAATVRERNQALMAAQQRVRRGPTPEVFFTPSSTAIASSRRSSSWSSSANRIANSG